MTSEWLRCQWYNDNHTLCRRQATQIAPSWDGGYEILCDEHLLFEGEPRSVPSPFEPVAEALPHLQKHYEDTAKSIAEAIERLKDPCSTT